MCVCVEGLHVFLGSMILVKLHLHDLQSLIYVLRVSSWHGALFLFELVDMYIDLHACL